MRPYIVLLCVLLSMVSCSHRDEDGVLNSYPMGSATVNDLYMVSSEWRVTCDKDSYDVWSDMLIHLQWSIYGEDVDAFANFYNKEIASAIDNPEYISRVIYQYIVKNLKTVYFSIHYNNNSPFLGA